MDDEKRAQIESQLEKDEDGRLKTTRVDDGSLGIVIHGGETDWGEPDTVLVLTVPEHLAAFYADQAEYQGVDPQALYLRAIKQAAFLTDKGMTEGARRFAAKLDTNDALLFRSAAIMLSAAVTVFLSEDWRTASKLVLGIMADGNEGGVLTPYEAAQRYAVLFHSLAANIRPLDKEDESDE